MAVIFITDVLKHADRNDSVKLFTQVTVIEETDVDRQTGATLCGLFGLFF
jgi:hypothetical protein